MPYKLLFVCLGNICRSPAAENVMNYLLVQANLDQNIICDSAGTAEYHIGCPPDPRMSIAAAKLLGIKLSGKARQFQPSDLAEFDLILAMDRENYRHVMALAQGLQYQEKVFLMCDFCSRYTLKDVPDPYYGGSEEFEHVIELLLDACGGLLKYVSHQTMLERKTN